MIAVEIVPAQFCHTHDMAARLLPEDEAEMAAVGMSGRRALYRSWRGSLWARTALVDGEPAAMWGVSGAPLGDVGIPWLLMAEPSRKVTPLCIARIYRHEVERMTRTFPILRQHVDVRHAKAIAMMRFAGFVIGEPVASPRTGCKFYPVEMKVA